jgi:aminoglycoside phosphotransferase (APT) family kinase protein
MEFKLPYHKVSDEIPGGILPTLEEIHATPTLPTDFLSHTNIAIIRKTFLAKYSPHASENEGFTLLFLERFTNIPAPKLYAMFRDGDNLYLVMELRPGIELKKIWAELGEREKGMIVKQLRKIVDEIKSVPRGTGGMYSNMMDGALPIRLFWSEEGDPTITGPFANEREFNLAIAKKSQSKWKGKTDKQERKSDFIARQLPSAFKDHKPTLTHADFHPGNILVDEIPSEEGSNERGFHVSGILDWEFAGWYPSYFEYAIAFVNFQWEDDWPEKLEEIVEPWPLEAAMLKLVHDELVF